MTALVITIVAPIVIAIAAPGAAIVPITVVAIAVSIVRIAAIVVLRRRRCRQRTQKNLLHLHAPALPAAQTNLATRAERRRIVNPQQLSRTRSARSGCAL